MTLDEQEALSHIYAHSARIVVLSSGNFAIFSGYELQCITASPTSAEITAAYNASVAKHAAAKPKPRLKLSADQLLKELGL